MVSTIVKSMYTNIEKDELEDLVNHAKVYIHDRTKIDNDASYIISCFTSSNALAGCTDYIDHRGNTLDQVKNLIAEGIKTRQCQRGSYYNHDGIPFNEIRVSLKKGGWDAYPQWSDRSKDFFTSQRESYRQNKR